MTSDSQIRGAPVSSIVVATDFSAAGEAALEWGRAVARSREARVDLVHAVQPPFVATDHISISPTTVEPYLQAAVFRYIIRILVTIPPVVIVLMLGVFRLRVGSMRATILSMIPAIVGAALTLGGIAWIQGTISIVSVLVPSVMPGIVVLPPEMLPLIWPSM